MTATPSMFGNIKGPTTPRRYCFPQTMKDLFDARCHANRLRTWLDMQAVSIRIQQQANIDAYYARRDAALAEAVRRDAERMVL